jgi:hypothetical protein
MKLSGRPIDFTRTRFNMNTFGIRARYAILALVLIVRFLYFYPFFACRVNKDRCLTTDWSPFHSTFHT